MLSIASILILLALWALLAAIECIPWPPQRHTSLYSNNPEYLAAVQRDTAAYLVTHKTVSDSVRQSVTAMGAVATQRLRGLAR